MPRQELEDLLQRKALVEDLLVNTEAQIYELEGAYLEETAASGNVIKGFDGYLGGVSGGGRPSSLHRKPRFKESDRLFSRSSATYERVRRALPAHISFSSPCSIAHPPPARRPARPPARPRCVPQSLGLDGEAMDEAAQNAAYEAARAEEAERERRQKKKRRIDPTPAPALSAAVERRISHKSRHRDSDEYLEISP